MVNVTLTSSIFMVWGWLVSRKPALCWKRQRRRVQQMWAVILIIRLIALIVCIQWDPFNTPYRPPYNRNRLLISNSHRHLRHRCHHHIIGHIDIHHRNNIVFNHRKAGTRFCAIRDSFESVRMYWWWWFTLIWKPLDWRINKQWIFSLCY